MVIHTQLHVVLSLEHPLGMRMGISLTSYAIPWGIVILLPSSRVWGMVFWLCLLESPVPSRSTKGQIESKTLPWPVGVNVPHKHMQGRTSDHQTKTYLSSYTLTWLNSRFSPGSSNKEGQPARLLSQWNGVDGAFKSFLSEQPRFLLPVCQFHALPPEPFKGRPPSMTSPTYVACCV